MTSLAEKLKARANSLGITHVEAAKRCGLDPRRYGHYVSGRSRPNYENLKKISIALGTTPNWLLSFEEHGTHNSAIEQLVASCRNLSSDQIKVFTATADSLSKHAT